MITEEQLQEATRSILGNLTLVQSTSVEINSWDLLDGPETNAPFIIIMNSDDVKSVQQTRDEINSYSLPLWLLISSTSQPWKDALAQFRDTRQEIFDLFNTANSAYRTLNGLAGVDVVNIQTVGPISYLYRQGSNVNTDTPEFITQYINLIIEVTQ